MQTTNRNVLIAAGVAVVAIVLIVLFLLLRGNNSTSGLTGTLWQLSSIREQTPAFQGVVPVADQHRYSITFNTDGTYSGTADCNRISGAYTTSGSDGITIKPGVSTLAMCPEDSFGPLFAHALTTATKWSIADGQLTLSRADGDSMTFVAGVPGASPVAQASPSASALASPSPSESASASPSASASESASASPSASPTPTPPPSAGPTATAAPSASRTPAASPSPAASATPAPTPTATPTPAPSASAPPAGGLTGVNWQLTAITVKEPAFAGQVPEANQPNYTIAFKTDGTFSAKADCNTVNGGYVAGANGSLALTLGPTTIVQCAEGSLSDLYLVAIGKTASYAIANGQLTITLTDGGTLVYKTAPAA